MSAGLTHSAFRELETMSLSEQREIFETFCREQYGGFGDGVLGFLKSKTVTKAKGEMIVKVLKEEPEAVHYSPKFKHWVKQRAYNSYPTQRWA